MQADSGWLGPSGEVAFARGSDPGFGRGIVPGAGAVYPGGVPILEYHKVNDRDDDQWTITTDDFTAHLAYLSEQGYTAISTEEFARYQIGAFQLPEKPIIITFDDGYVDMLDNMRPIMEAFWYARHHLHGDELCRHAAIP